MKDQNETFSYSYSAKQQEEIKRIREKYLPPKEDKIELLRRLDQSVTRPGTVAALIVGIISTLIFGLGMCCCMLWTEQWLIPGILIGLVGMAGDALTYPLYNHITQRQRRKLAPEIMKLTDELMK